MAGNLYSVTAEIYPRLRPSVGSDDWVSHDEESGPAGLAAMLHVDQSIGREDAAHGSHLLAEAGGTAALPNLGQRGGIGHHGRDTRGVHGGDCAGASWGAPRWTLVYLRLSVPHHSDARKAGRVLVGHPTQPRTSGCDRWLDAGELSPQVLAPCGASRVRARELVESEPTDGRGDEVGMARQDWTVAHTVRWRTLGGDPSRPLRLPTDW